MKTLFENLKPEILEKLEQEALLYPNATARKIAELKANCFWIDLTVNTAVSLCNLNDKNLGVEELVNLFNKD